MARAVSGSKTGSGTTWGTEATNSLLAFQQPAIPPSPATFYSPWPSYPDASQQGGAAVVPQITVSGGTVSSITIGGGSSVGTSGTFGVNNLQPVVVTYTVAPTVTWSLAPMFTPDPLNAKSLINT